jgi:hypothetical protein
MKPSVAAAVTIKVRLSPRLQRIARLLTVGLMGSFAFLTAEQSEPVASSVARSDGSDHAMAEAWALAQRAQALLEQRRPAAALVGFERAYALSSDPSLLLEVARLENEVGSPARAAHALEVFLDRPSARTPAPQRQLALNRLKALSSQTARVTVQTNVQGAEAELEADRGVARSDGFVVSLLLDVGERRINLSKPGYETQTVSLTLEPGEVRTMRVDLDKAAKGRSQNAPAKPRWALFDAASSESVNGVRTTL